MGIFVFYLFVLGGLLILSGLKIVNQYEKGIVLTLGKYTGSRTPGLTWLFPVIQKMQKVDMRVGTIDIAKKEVITKDNVPARVDGVVYFAVEKPEVAILEVQNYVLAIAEYAQAALRDVIGSVDLDVLLAEREHIAQEIERHVGEVSAQWGVKITSIRMHDIELPEDMKRVMARQAEAERDRRAVIIRAEGELSASQNMRQAAENLAATKGGLALRTLTTIENLDKPTIVALPVELLEGFQKLLSK